MANLDTMPEEVMKVLFRKLDLKAIISLHKTNHYLRAMVETVPSVPFDIVEVRTSNVKAIMKLRIGSKKLGIGYLPQGNDCLVVRMNHVSRMENTKFFDVFLGDLKFIMKVLRTTLTCFNFFHDADGKHLTDIVGALISARRVRKSFYPATSITLKAPRQMEAMMLVSMFDKDIIKNIKLLSDVKHQILEVNNLMTTQQWLKAEQINLADFLIRIPAVKFVKFKYARVASSVNPINDINDLTLALQTDVVCVELNLIYPNHRGPIRYKEVSTITIHRRRYHFTITIVNNTVLVKRHNN